MSGLLYNRGGFYAQGTESLGKGVSQEQTTLGTTAAPNGTSGTPMALINSVATVIATGKVPIGLKRLTN